MRRENYIKWARHHASADRGLTVKTAVIESNPTGKRLLGTPRLRIDDCVVTCQECRSGGTMERGSGEQT